MHFSSPLVSLFFVPLIAGAPVLSKTESRRPVELTSNTQHPFNVNGHQYYFQVVRQSGSHEGHIPNVPGLDLVEAFGVEARRDHGTTATTITDTVNYQGRTYSLLFDAHEYVTDVPENDMEQIVGDLLNWNGALQGPESFGVDLYSGTINGDHNILGFFQYRNL